MKRQGQSSMVDLSHINFGKIPPQAVDMEDAVLNVVLNHIEGYDSVSDLLRPECFYKNSNQIIFKAIRDLAKENKPVDLLTVVQQLRKTDELENAGGPYEITKLTNALWDPLSVVEYAKVVYEKYILRKLIEVSYQVIHKAFDDITDPFELMDFAEREIAESHVNSDSDMVKIDDVIFQTFKQIEEWRGMESNITGIPTGFTDIDNATRGLQNGDFIVLAARTSTGKSALALNIARNAAKNDLRSVPVGIWSMEMKAMQMVLRMMAAESKILLHKLQTGNLTDEEMFKLEKLVSATLAKLKIRFNEKPNVNMESIKRTARKLKRKGELGLMIIDYLQLIKSIPGSRENREQVLAQISRDLKNLAGELWIPIIALAQLNRAEGSKGIKFDSNGPPISSIRECGAIEQDADLIMMAWGPTEEEIGENRDLDGLVKVRIAKQRNGVIITNTLDFKSEIQLFKNIEKVVKGSKEITGREIIKDVDPDDDLPF